MAQALSFASLHMGVAFAVGYAMTGTPWVGRALAEPACNTVVFYFHEKVWARIEARRSGAPLHV